MIQAYFKGKLVIQDNCIKQNEDLKTSSSIGLLQYLPDDIFWNIMRNCCVGFNIEDFGKILSFNFWEHTDSQDTTNENFVEPDVWIETEKFDVIIEAKVGDYGGQYIGQWQNEIQSIKNEQCNNDYEKPIVLIALGGNDNMLPEKVLDCPVYKASWYNLLNAVVSERDAQKINNNICRILDDVIELFARQGVMTVTWLNSLPKYEVNETALNAWEITRAKSSVGFENLNIVFVNDKNIQQWQPIN